MTDKNKELLHLVMQDKTLNELALESNLSNKQVMNRLNTIENNGYTLDRKYYYSGDIRYSLKTDLQTKDEKVIITTPDDQCFRVMLISDLHVGTTLESASALHLVYDYCVKNNIHIIINTGDLIHGGLSPYNIINIYDYKKQFEHLLKIYPYDKNILNIITLGNHDLDPLTQEGLNIHKLLNQRRHDLISLGYEANKIKVKNQEIYLRHSPEQKFGEIVQQTIFLSGHSHFTKISSGSNYLKIRVPSLSNVQVDGPSKLSYQLPNALLADFEFKKGYFKNYSIKQLLISDKVYVINTIEGDLVFNQKFMNNNQIINNEEMDEDGFQKSKHLINQFNARYHSK